MKKLLSILLPIVLLFGFVSCNEEPPIIPGLTKSRIYVETEPEYATVTFNNKSVNDITPLLLDELEPGFYKFSFKLDKHKDTTVYLFTRRGIYDTLFVEILEAPQYWWTIYNPQNSQLPTKSINKIVVDKTNTLYLLSGSHGIIKYDGINWNVINTSNSGIPSDVVNDLIIEDSGVMWVATSKGFAKFDGSNWIVFNMANSGLPGNYITTLALDKNRILWLGTYGHGLLKFDGVSFTNYTIYNSELPANQVTSIAVDNNNNKWIGTWGEGTARFDGLNWEVFNFLKSHTLSNYVSYVLIDKGNTVWIGSGSGNSPGGLTKIEGGIITNYSLQNSMIPGRIVTSIAIDSKNTKWICTSDGGVAMLRDKKWKVYNDFNSGLPMNSAVSIAVDLQDNKWIISDGLAKYIGQK
jgi:ligand-binding sensor domain-containing protein